MPQKPLKPCAYPGCPEDGIVPNIRLLQTVNIILLLVDLIILAHTITVGVSCVTFISLSTLSAKNV